MQGSVGSCHDDITEVLTKDGWKLFKYINKEDSLATVNPLNGDLFFEKPTNIISYYYEGDMYHFKHQSLDCLVTPNHNMLVRKFVEKHNKRTLNDSYELTEAKDVGWYCGLMNKVNYLGKNEQFYKLEGLKCENGWIVNEKIVDMKYWLRLLGVFVAEGTMLDPKTAHWRIQIAGVKKRERDFIENTLKKLDIHTTVYKDRYYINNKQIWLEFEKLGFYKVKAPFKKVPEFVFELNPELISEFLLGFLMGDGTITQNGSVQYFTSSEVLADHLQLLVLLSGKWSNISVDKDVVGKIRTMKDGRQFTQNYPAYTICVWKSNNLSISKKNNLTIKPYNGVVYCAEVPTFHTLVTRRNGKILISGNCVPHSIHGYCREITEEKQNNKYIMFSLGFGYANRKPTDYQGEGMYPRECLQNLKEFGAVPYEYFPYNEEYPGILNRLNPIKEQLLKIAYSYRISSYCRLYSVDEIKTALMNLGAVTICIPVYQSFYSVGKDGLVPIPKNGEKLHGFHMMTITGWKKSNQWVVYNSWSENWGDKGKCYIPFNFPITEAWSITDNILPEPIKPDPKPEPDNKIKIFDVAPIIINGRTMLELRNLANITGCINIMWNAQEKKITLQYKDKSIIMWIDKKEYKVARGIGFYVYEDRIFDVAPTLMNGRTLLEVRNLANITDAKRIDWNEKNKEVTLTYPDKTVKMWIGKKEYEIAGK